MRLGPVPGSTIPSEAPGKPCKGRNGKVAGNAGHEDRCWGEADNEICLRSVPEDIGADGVGAVPHMQAGKAWCLAKHIYTAYVGRAGAGIGKGDVDCEASSSEAVTLLQENGLCK